MDTVLQAGVLYGLSNNKIKLVKKEGGLNASKVLEWVIKKTHDEIRSASNWVMEVILERSKEEVCGRVRGGDKELLEQPEFFQQERTKLK